ncbi:hypothetical protein BK127_10550 [Paenibacillus sp. FSL H7-0331]|nr:hypothetical protein BK127_10550 [Paenibacillus sp. FSL H7-0331]
MIHSGSTQLEIAATRIPQGQQRLRPENTKARSSRHPEKQQSSVSQRDESAPRTRKHGPAGTKKSSSQACPAGTKAPREHNSTLTIQGSPEGIALWGPPLGRVWEGGIS